MSMSIPRPPREVRTWCLYQEEVFTPNTGLTVTSEYGPTVTTGVGGVRVGLTHLSLVLWDGVMQMKMDEEARKRKHQAEARRLQRLVKDQAAKIQDMEEQVRKSGDGHPVDDASTSSKSSKITQDWMDEVEGEKTNKGRGHGR